MRRTKAGHLNPEEKLIVYWETIRHISELNKTAELKAGLIMSFFGLVLGELQTKRSTHYNCIDLLLFCGSFHLLRI